MAEQIKVKIFNCLKENLEQAINQWLKSACRQIVVENATTVSTRDRVLHVVYYNGGSA